MMLDCLNLIGTTASPACGDGAWDAFSLRAGATSHARVGPEAFPYIANVIAPRPQPAADRTVWVRVLSIRGPWL